MTNELATTNAQKAVAMLKGGVKNVRKALPSQQNMSFLKFEKDGTWTFGMENIEPEEGSLWAVNPMQIKHGFVCWTNYAGKERKNEKLGEVYSSIAQEPIKVEDLQKHDFPWKPAASLQLKCLNGEDEGTEVLYNTSSRGGIDFVNKLIDALDAHLDDAGDDIVPVISLEYSTYKHEQYGKIYTPDFKLKKWMPLAGPVEEAPKQVTKNSAPEVENDEDIVEVPEVAAQEVVQEAPVAAKTRTRRRRKAS